MIVLMDLPNSCNINALIHIKHHLRRLGKCLHYKPILPEQYKANPKFIFNYNFDLGNEVLDKVIFLQNVHLCLKFLKAMN